MIEFPEIISNQTKISLQHLEFLIETIGNNAKVKVIESIKNESEEDCNVNISLQLDDESAVVGYSFKNHHGEFVSQLKEKEQAKIEQRDATANGYSSAMMEQKDDNSLDVSLGLVMKGTEVSFTIEYLTRIDVDDEKMIFTIPIHPMRKNIPTKVKVFGTSSFEWEGLLEEEKEFSIDIATEGMMIMRDEDTDEVALSSTFINREKDAEVNVIFVCDRSGSMGGEGIENLKIMLQLFLRQLPLTSKFNIVSFGDRFDFMFKEMTSYNEVIMKQASSNVSLFSSNYGGTEMSKPLQDMINNHIENTHIILLTDGEDFNKSKVIECVKQLSEKNIIHGVGLGRRCDMNMMKTCSQIGRGVNVHAKDPNKLGAEVSKITQRILIPSLINCQLKWNIEGEMYPKEVSIFGGVMTCYLKVNDEEQLLKENQMITCQLNGKAKAKEYQMKNEIEWKKEKEMNNILLHQLIAFQEIRKLEGEGKKEEAKKLSLKYNVLCKETAFIAIDKTTRNEVNDIKTISLYETEQFKEHYSATIGSASPMRRMRYSNLAPIRRGTVMKCSVAPSRDPLIMECCHEIQPDTNMKKMKSSSIIPPISSLIKTTQRMLKACCKKTESEHYRKKRIQEEPRREVEMEIHKTIPSQPQQKKSYTTKRECFNLIINSQNAIGQFIAIEQIFDQLKSFDYQGIPKVFIHTYFIVELLQSHFNEFKIEWKLLVKKAQQWLDSQSIILSDEMKQSLLKIMTSFSF